jgi:hypothetical protein
MAETRTTSAAPRTSARYARPRILAATAAIAAFGALPAAAAADDTTAFKPVDRTARALVFRPHTVNSSKVVHASVTYRLARGKRAVRRDRQVSIQRVRRALERGKSLKVTKPRRAHGGRLLIASGSDEEQAAPSGTCAFGSFTAASPPGACWRPYADSSPFNRGVGVSPRLLSNSSTIVGRVNDFGPPDNLSVGGSTDWGHPVYYSQAGDPVFTVHCTKPWGTCEVEGAQVQIPDAARVATAGDGHLAVVDQSGGWEYDFWQVADKPSGGGTLTVAWGGKTRIGTADSDGLNSNATAAHFGLLAGVIRPPELDAGQINHALTMSVKCTNGTYVWPAEGPGSGTPCSSLGLSNSNAPALGQHFMLDMSDGEIDGLTVPAWKKTILKAMAHYGMFVGDTGGAAWGIQFESAASYTSFGYADPWVELANKWAVPTYSSAASRTVRVFGLRDGVDWGKLRAVDPCVAQGTC